MKKDHVKRVDARHGRTVDRSHVMTTNGTTEPESEMVVGKVVTTTGTTQETTTMAVRMAVIMVVRRNGTNMASNPSMYLVFLLPRLIYQTLLLLR